MNIFSVPNPCLFMAGGVVSGFGDGLEDEAYIGCKPESGEKVHLPSWFFVVGFNNKKKNET